MPSVSTPVSFSGHSLQGDYVATIPLCTSDNFRATILPLGARLVDLRLPDGHPLVLTIPSLSAVEEDTAYIGAFIGRIANRVRNGNLGSYPAHLLCNAPPHHIHGGKTGWTHRLFAVTDRKQDSVRLEYLSPDGDQGYPSSVKVVVTYQLKETGILSLVIETHNVGNTDTVTNPTFHPYFDLSGMGGTVNGAVKQWKVSMKDCDSYLEVDEANVPTGKVKRVEGTNFDFSKERTIMLQGDEAFQGYDTYWVASNKVEDKDKLLVTVKDNSGVEMEVWSNQPGFQMYTANGFDGTGEQKFDQYGSLAIEPSGWIDAVNHAHFPTTELPVGSKKTQTMLFKFKKV